jgi:type III secretory pathway component EscS
MTNVISSSHLINILSPVIRDAVYGIIIGMMEMTNGCSIIAGSSIPIEIKLIIINFLISFSGASILFQTIAVTSDFILDLKRYMISRFIFGVMSSLLCSFMLILL